MKIFDIILIAFGLAMDAAAVSLVASASGFIKTKRAVFRLSFHFGLFQFLMPVLGWFLGCTFASYIISFDHWIAFLLLSLVGVHMVFESFKNENDEDCKKNDPSKGITMILLSIATSIDAFAIGISLAMLEVDIWYASVIIGVITAVLSLIAIRLGKSLGQLFGKRMELLGGILLVLIGIKILVEHLS